MDDRFEHDVFISYSHANEDLVREHVIRPLEEAGLCLMWDELFNRGKPLLAEIEEGIRSSRKTLIILTREHLDAETGFLEYEAIVTRTLGVRERTERLIIVAFGDVQVPEKYAVNVCAHARNEDELESEIQKIIRQLRPDRISLMRMSHGGSVLAIGAHWDDILLGCLGFLIKLKRVYKYHVDILTLCTSYGDYYRKEQPDLEKTVGSIYQQVCKECKFNSLREMLDKEVRIRKEKALEDGFLSEQESFIKGSLAQVIKENKKTAERPYNLILCPPIDDMNEDHAVASRAVFSQFRDPEHTILEYPVKAYTNRTFTPNLCVGLDDRVTADHEPHSAADEKVRIITEVCRITEKIYGSDRLLGEEALRARMLMHAIDYHSKRDVRYAEIFRGRLEL